MFTLSMVAMTSFVVMLYLLGVYAFSGVIDILRAFEAKNYGSSAWMLKLLGGLVYIVFAVVLLIIGFFVGNSALLVYGFCVSLVYSAVVRIITAFRKTAIVFIA